MDYSEALALGLWWEWEELIWTFGALLVWTAFLGLLAAIFGGVVSVSGRTLRLRRFWCAWANREVEVRFEESGPPGFREVLRVVECSAFEPTSAIGCRRGCQDGTCRCPTSPPEPWAAMRASAISAAISAD